MNRLTYFLLLLLVAGALVGATGAGAQTSPGHDLSWHVVAAGGAPMAGAGHRVNGTLGQPAIGPAAGPAHGAGLGYWYGLPQETGFKVYLPLVTRGG